MAPPSKAASSTSVRKSAAAPPPPPALLQGTLDLMILKTLSLASSSGGEHGYGIARRIHQQSKEVLLVEEGSLYPALHRLEKRGYVTALWKQSESNRRAKYYRLSAAGRRQLKADEAQWNLLAGAVQRVLMAAAT